MANYKAKDLPVTTQFLAGLWSPDAPFPKQKWVEFCEALLKEGYWLTLYEARQTYSKYITVRKAGHSPFKVRFSNHKPIKSRELSGDCDFFVGVTNLGIANTQMALSAVRKHFST
jgi:hypothetical protein